jgi:hypothetical protein
MNERALLLNGRLNIISSPGHGTKVELRIPLQPPESTNIHTQSDSSV